MASTSFSLGPHWESFIKTQVESGRYGSVSEVVRAGLRELEDRTRKLAALQAHVAEGLAQADRGEFVEDFSMEKVIAKANRQKPEIDAADPSWDDQIFPDV